jgi:Tfp pilus assembly protein PilX
MIARLNRALSRSRRRQSGDADPAGERGAALPMVLIIGMVLMTLVGTATLFAVSSLRKSDSDADWNAAMAAAYAGVEDYQSRLANEGGYWRYGNSAAPYTANSSSAVTLPAVANSAFGTGASGTWATVAGSGGAARYRYEVDNSTYAQSGVLKLRSTGRVGDQVRSVVVDLKQKGFLDFLYFTNFEIQDPLYSGDDETSCSKYAYAGRPGGLYGTSCSPIAFGSGDVLNGPVHSNDAIRICDATMNGAVTTAYKNTSGGSNYVARNSSGHECSGQSFPLGKPAKVDPLPMPPTNSEMRNEVRWDLAERPGCLYTGPTSIQLHANGTMTIRSPRTKFTQISATGHRNDPQRLCGTPGTGSGQLGSASGQTLAVLDRNLIFVQDIPTNSSDGNYTSTTDLPATCTSGNGVGFPYAGENFSRSTTTALQSYNCRRGDVFIKGDMNGQMTVAAQNYAYVTGDITYVDANDDVLGIVGNGSVFVHNPITCSSYYSGSYEYSSYRYKCKGGQSSSLGGSANRRIDAAMVAVVHTFMVQNYDAGRSRGTLTVNGAIAQQFRGTVQGTFDGQVNGYVKSYNYDLRLRYLAPPKFLMPASTTYGVSQIVEVKTAYNPDGSAAT